MRLTIIPADGMVVINNYFYNNLDLSNCSIPINIHALQWYEIEGELEFIDNVDRTKPLNETIDSLPTWATKCIDAWNLAKIAEEEVIRIEQEKQKAIQLEIEKTMIPNTEI